MTIVHRFHYTVCCSRITESTYVVMSQYCIQVAKGGFVGVGGRGGGWRGEGREGSRGLGKGVGDGMCVDELARQFF